MGNGRTGADICTGRLEGYQGCSIGSKKFGIMGAWSDHVGRTAVLVEVCAQRQDSGRCCESTLHGGQVWRPAIPIIGTGSDACGEQL